MSRHAAALPGSGRLDGASIRLVKRLGAGGMGAVYEGVQEHTGRRVAVKLLLEGVEGDAFADAVLRLTDEAQAAAKLEHPDLVTIFAAGLDPGLGPYIVYQLLEGGSLRDELRRRAGRSWPEALQAVAEPLLGALHALHSVGVIHRDVKPENLLRGADGRYKLTDLGLAVFEQREARTATGVLVGTPGYLSPEFLGDRAQPASPRSDVYAAAMVVAESLLGRHPVLTGAPGEGPGLGRQLTWEPTPSELVHLGLPRHLAAPLAASLARDPARRPASALELLQELRREPVGAVAAATLRLPAVSESGVVPAPRFPSRRPVAAAVAALVAAACLALVFWRLAPLAPQAPSSPSSSSSSSLLLLLRADGDLPRPATLVAIRAAPPGEVSYLVKNFPRGSPVHSALRYLEEQARPGGPRPEEAQRLLLEALRLANRTAKALDATLEPDRLALERWLLVEAARAVGQDGPVPAELAEAAEGTLEALTRLPLAAVRSPEGSGLLSAAEWLRCRAYFARPGGGGGMPPAVRSAMARLSPLGPGSRPLGLTTGPNDEFQAALTRCEAASRRITTITNTPAQVDAARREHAAAAADMVAAWWTLDARALAPRTELEQSQASAMLVMCSGILLVRLAPARRTPEWLKHVVARGLETHRVVARGQVELRRMAAALARPGPARLWYTRSAQADFAFACSKLDTRTGEALPGGWSSLLGVVVADAVRWDESSVATRAARALVRHRQAAEERDAGRKAALIEAALAEGERAYADALTAAQAARGSVDFGPTLRLVDVAFGVYFDVARRNSAAASLARPREKLRALVDSLTPAEAPPGGEVADVCAQIGHTLERR